MNKFDGCVQLLSTSPYHSWEIELDQKTQQKFTLPTTPPPSPEKQYLQGVSKKKKKTIFEITVTPLFIKETFLNFVGIVAKWYSFAIVKIFYKIKLQQVVTS